MKKNILFAFIASLFIFGCATQNQNTTSVFDRNVQPKPGPAPKINLGKPQSFELPNGLKVLVVENHKLPRVSVSLKIDNGSIYEGEKAGVASLTGSVLGSGTKTITKDDFNDEIDFLGARVSFSSQSAYMSSLSKYFPKVLGLMADGAINPVFTQEEFDSQKNQLIEGLKMGENDVASIAGKVQSALVYGKNHPKGEFITPQTAANVTLNDVTTFYNTYFKPNNAYLVVIGDVNFDETKKLITDKFSGWKKGTVSSYNSPKVSNPSETEIDFVNMPDAVQSNIAVTNAIYLKKSDADYFAALLANKILGGGSDARLFNNLRETHGYTYGAYSTIGNDHNDASKFKAFAKVRNAVTDSSVVEFVNEIKRIRTELVSAEELKIAKASYTGKFVRALEKPSTAAKYALNIETENLPKDFYENYLKNINAVTAQDIKNAANKYLQLDKARIVIVGKAADVLPALEKLPYTINYFDKNGEPSTKPTLGKGVSEGITAKSVLESYIKAIGGATKINAVKTVLSSYETSTPMGTINIIEKRTSDKLAQTTLVNGNPMSIIVATPTEMFMKQGANKMPLPPAFVEDTKGTLGTFIEVALLNNTKVKLSGIEKINDNDAYKLELAGKTITTQLFYDVKTGLKVRETSIINMGGKSQKNITNLSDYKEKDGILFAHKKTATLGPQPVELTLKDVKINTGVTAADFE